MTISYLPQTLTYKKRTVQELFNKSHTTIYFAELLKLSFIPFSFSLAFTQENIVLISKTYMTQEN